MRFRNASGERIRLGSGARMNDTDCCCDVTHPCTKTDLELLSPVIDFNGLTFSNGSYNDGIPPCGSLEYCIGPAWSGSTASLTAQSTTGRSYWVYEWLYNVNRAKTSGTPACNNFDVYYYWALTSTSPFTSWSAYLLQGSSGAVGASPITDWNSLYTSPYLSWSATLSCPVPNSFSMTNTLATHYCGPYGENCLINDSYLSVPDLLVTLS